ncbi:MAG: hypothetical protein ACRCU5_00940 [Rhizobiaceae bacterium]
MLVIKQMSDFDRTAALHKITVSQTEGPRTLHLFGLYRLSKSG